MGSPETLKIVATNQGVVGSIPASRTIKINGLALKRADPFFLSVAWGSTEGPTGFGLAAAVRDRIGFVGAGQAIGGPVHHRARPPLTCLIGTKRMFGCVMPSQMDARNLQLGAAGFIASGRLTIRSARGSLFQPLGRTTHEVAVIDVAHKPCGFEA